MDDFKSIYNIFNNLFSVNNLIDQRIQFEFPNTVNIKFEDNSVKIKNVKYKYENSLRNIVSKETNLNYAELNNKKDFIDLTKIISEQKNYITNYLDAYHSELYDEEYEIYNCHNLVSEINYEVNTIQKVIRRDKIDRKYLKGEIVTVNVDSDITLYVKCTELEHNQLLEYTFQKPNSEDSQFMALINDFDVNNVTELEFKNVILSRKSNSEWSKKDKGWYINYTPNIYSKTITKIKNLINY